MRSVYLFELDSVRKTDEEVIEGQKALFDEIVCNGNCVVLSMNQLTDSRAILSMLHTDQQASVLLKLFQSGYLKYSRFGTYRTPSYYIQRSIEEKRSFIYSSLPMKSNQYYLQEEVLNALKYADPSKISELMEKQKASETTISVFDEAIGDRFIASPLSKKEAIETLEYLKRFVELIIQVSMYGEYALPAGEYTDTYPFRSFECFMEHILSFDFSLFASEQADASLTKMELAEAKCLLTQIKEELVQPKRNVNSRSEWLLCLLSRQEAHTMRILSFVECIIHLCYNYTVEYSMYNVSKHYETAPFLYGENASFRADFFGRLRYEWERDSGHEERCLKEESNQFQWFDDTKQCPDWDLALRMLQKGSEPSIDEGRTALYENDYFKRREARKKQNYHHLIKIVGASLLSLIPIILYMWIEDSATGLSDQVISQLFSNDIVKVILVFVAANFMTLIMEKIATVSNLWEIIKACKRSWKDFVHLSAAQVASYVNWGAVDQMRFEARREPGELSENKRANLLKYQALWESRHSLFQENALLPLVDPKTEYTRMEQYELAHHTQLGVVHESPYYLHIVDLIRKEQDHYYSYERLLPTVPSGAIAVVARCHGRYLLLRQFRHAIRAYQLSFIRGFGEDSISAIENVKKEVMEEVGGVIMGEPRYLGQVTGDSGITGTRVSVYAVDLERYEGGAMAEGIEEVVLYTEQELMDAIRRKDIEDSFTLAAYVMHRCQA